MKIMGANVDLCEVGLSLEGVYQASLTVPDMAQPSDRASSAVTLDVQPASTPSSKIWLPLILRQRSAAYLVQRIHSPRHTSNKTRPTKRLVGFW